jgi:transcriptional regulator with GAF, ATPase, and Fis domain
VRKLGRFEVAHRGTLFLDEIGDLPMAMQAKILRAIEERQFERVGGTQTLRVDVRVVAATHRNLKARAAERLFREDLYFRLSVFPIRVPPLRERHGDVILLARYFIERFCRDLSKPVLGLSPEAMDALSGYSWPGNVRELQNCIERAAILCEEGPIKPRDLNLPVGAAAPSAPASSPWDQIDLSGTLAEAVRRATAEVERRKIVQAIKEAGSSRSLLAELLGVHPAVLSQKLREYGIEGP